MPKNGTKRAKKKKKIAPASKLEKKHSTIGLRICFENV